MTMDPKDAGSPMGIAVLRADEKLCMAIFVILERLTPGERAVFLLRQIFGYRYAAIATMLELREGDCKQMLQRAQEHISAVRSKFKASPLPSSRPSTS